MAYSRFRSEPLPRGPQRLHTHVSRAATFLLLVALLAPRGLQADDVAEARTILRAFEYRSAALQEFSATVVERRTMARAGLVHPTQAGYVLTAASGVAPVVRTLPEAGDAPVPSAVNGLAREVVHDLDLLHRMELTAHWCWAETIVLPSDEGGGTPTGERLAPFRWPRAICFSDGDRVVEVDYSSGSCGIERARDLRLAVPVIARVLSDLVATVSRACMEVLRDDYLGTYVNEFPPRIVGTEEVNGVPCRVLQLQGRVTRHRYWVATEHGFIVMREDVLAYRDGAPDDLESYRIQERSDVIQTGDTMWVPRQWQEAYYVYDSDAVPATWVWSETRQLRAEHFHLAPSALVPRPDLDLLIPLGFMVFDRPQNRAWVQGEIDEVMDLMPAFPEPASLLKVTEMSGSTH